MSIEGTTRSLPDQLHYSGSIDKRGKDMYKSSRKILEMNEAALICLAWSATDC